MFDCLIIFFKMMTGHYIADDYIDEGTFGTVWMCHRYSTNYALKIEKILGDGSLHREAFYLKHLQSVDDLRNVRVIRIIDEFSREGKLHLVLPLYDTSLFHVIHHPKLDDSQRQRYASQLIEAVGFIHSREIMHFDINPRNVLLKGDSIVLSDFGDADFYSKGRLYYTKKVTKYTRPPELFVYMSNEILWAPLDCSVDIYSLGITIAWLLRAKIPYPPTNVFFEQVRMWGNPPLPITMGVLLSSEWRRSDAEVAQSLRIPEYVVRMFDPDSSKRRIAPSE